MQISLVTPAGKQSRSGNRQTAVRWARVFRDLGHRVRVAEQDTTPSADMMVAVHAYRSAESIRAYADRYPDRPLVVLLAGTDVYRFQDTDPVATLGSMERATALIGINELVHRSIPERFHKKLRVILQSADPLPFPRARSKRTFDVCVAGHLRDEKDSLRAALAARLLPETSRLRVVLLGKAHNASWQRAAEKEAARNDRLIWRGEVARWQVRRQFARSHAMVISSVMEGGANVVSEAIAAGLPVIASDIDGNLGLLGEDYRGTYRVGDEADLARVLNEAETNPAYLRDLTAQLCARQRLVTPAAEMAAWRKLLGSF